ncbi:MAG TPA: STAS domain-containing protein [Solirubrobacteraceae bacterium]|jgi:anti-anti-sigma factor|nr:STAS domain-containing protein [Solirubrobacteraceae bacterium]
MFVEHEAQPAVPDTAVATGSNARYDLRASPLPFTAFAHLEGDRAIVILNGELDMASIAILIDSILIDCFVGTAFAVEEVVLDFAELDSIDGSGLLAIAAAAQQVTAHGGAVSIRSPRLQIQRLLELVDFKQIAAIEP